MKPYASMVYFLPSSLPHLLPLHLLHQHSMTFLRASPLQSFANSVKIPKMILQNDILHSIGLNAWNRSD